MPTISRIQPIVWMLTPLTVVVHGEGEHGADGRKNQSDSETHASPPFGRELLAARSTVTRGRFEVRVAAAERFV